MTLESCMTMMLMPGVSVVRWTSVGSGDNPLFTYTCSGPRDYLGRDVKGRDRDYSRGVSPVIPLSTRSSNSLGARPSKELRAKGPGDSLAQVQDVNIAENYFPTFHGNTLNRFRQAFPSGPTLLIGRIPNPNRPS